VGSAGQSLAQGHADVSNLLREATAARDKIAEINTKHMFAPVKLSSL
jgi:hypothetical protein